jgi:hypothetical protein
MNSKIFIFSFFILFIACKSNDNDKKVNVEILNTIDSLKQEIVQLKSAQNSSIDSSELPKDTKISIDTIENRIKVPDEIKETTTKETQEPKTTKSKKIASDTIYHYFKPSGKLSVKIAPMLEGRRKIFFYNYLGEITIVLEDVNLSFSESHSINFRENGSVNNVKKHTNPGASRYWYECNITFSNSNEPEWMVCEQLPMESLDDFFNKNKYYWDKKNKSWVKQEIVREQDTPKN